MPVCEVCYEDMETVYRCKDCGTLFCSECGSVKEELCLYCLKEE